MPGGAEYERLYSMLSYEREAKALGRRLTAGLDEAGRGPLAGPVVSAAVILPDNYMLEGLNDSKKLSAKTRDRLFECLSQDVIGWGVGVCSPQEIDEINILNATFLSMERALAALEPAPDYLLIDALKLKRIKTEQKSIIKGDALSLSIAAASVLAKVIRDRVMLIYDKLYPEYGFAKHKGYGTKEHLTNINRYGLCPIHRKTFNHDAGRYEQLEL